MIKLYTYFRSSASYRVRIALNLKGLPFESIPVHLLRAGGLQHTPDYARINPAQLVPTLVDGELTLGQSLAIIEYLEEMYPEPALLPTDAAGRARVRALGQTIACEIHPLNNLRVLQYLEHELKMDQAARANWYRHWITLGFTALEAMLDNSPGTGAFCHGEQPTLADDARTISVSEISPSLCLCLFPCLSLSVSVSVSVPLSLCVSLPLCL